MKVSVWKFDDGSYSICCDKEVVEMLVDTITGKVDSLIYDSEYDKAKDYLIARSDILEKLDEE